MAMCPIEAAKRCTPSWFMEIKSYVGVEVAACREYRNGDGFSVERCDANEAEFWSLYGRKPGGTAEWFKDFNSESEARSLAESLASAYPHLATSLVPDSGLYSEPK
jgi:hypothetical protein